ncbi:MAG: cysteate synthase [Methanocalculus sp. MSAO_Arc1]|uniref:cysteate synthase n=1 Tax=Methanocalculus TaxID=71151 RepID=UPI000FF823B6|nr:MULTISPECIES: cysteate synthase [unclassified Methanocalculus]MCP1661491.1 cysteate synthase [Methanocalculus sp. AMF5]RQD79767.1 MAG: cysteate synthase [Methanocalculus sp. MSAO_Arc1]
MTHMLSCPVCRSTFPDQGELTCPGGHPGLLRAIYPEERLVLRDEPGLFRYQSWLPVREIPNTGAGPVTFRSVGFARETGLSELWIGFSGYAPGRGAHVPTCSFKELEAWPTLQRVRETGGGTLVVASAGNTGRAFAEVADAMNQPVLLVIPKRALERIWTTKPARNTILVAVNGDYSDAIALADRICTLPGYTPEGGAKNVARRDGMGTVFLDAACTIGRIPDHYIQAVGSGTGAIAAWEAALRLVADGRFGGTLPRLHLAQNLPFIPLKSAWDARRREIVPELDMPHAEDAIRAVNADVLTNRKPPYAVPGGLYDALSDCGGAMYGITNHDARQAGDLFEATEGIDPDPAAAVACAALLAAVDQGDLPENACILLNITGGGYKAVPLKHTVQPVETVQPGEMPSFLAGEEDV